MFRAIIISDHPPRALSGPRMLIWRRPVTRLMTPFLVCTSGRLAEPFDGKVLPTAPITPCCGREGRSASRAGKPPPAYGRRLPPRLRLQNITPSGPGETPLGSGGFKQWHGIM